MFENQIYIKNLYSVIILFLLFSCNNHPDGNIVNIEKKAVIEPDYSEVTIPLNIAPLNFIIKETGSSYYVKFSSASGTEIEISSPDGEIQIPEDKWHKMLQNNAGKKIKVDIYTKDKDCLLLHISEPTRLGMISYAVFCLKKK